MHSSTYEGEDWKNEPWKVTFLHNGDYSGDTKIVVPAAAAELEEYNQTVTVEVPYEAIQQFVLDQMRRELVSKLEMMEYDKLAEFFGTQL